jgi:2Fe-2S ferredoxin
MGRFVSELRLPICLDCAATTPMDERVLGVRSALVQAHGIEIEHACEQSCACTTCHAYVREGLGSLEEPSEDEEDYLDKAWGLEPDSRRGCQAIVGDEDPVVEIPKYTINMVSERHYPERPHGTQVDRYPGHRHRPG